MKYFNVRTRLIIVHLCAVVEYPIYFAKEECYFSLPQEGLHLAPAPLSPFPLLPPEVLAALSLANFFAAWRHLG
jgi:hypothetical protein